MAVNIGKIDLHMHTTVSDGTDTPEGLLQKVKAAGITVFSVTDHDAVKAGGIIRSCLRDGDPKFIQGAEFSCRDDQGKYHILGYGFDPGHAAMQRLVEHGHGIRMKKVTARLEFLRSEFGFTFSEGEIRSLLALDNPGKPHIANLMIRHGYAGTRKQAIDEFINRARVAKEYIGPAEAIGSIADAGGVPVLAHPFFGSGDELILGEEMEERLKRLIGYGLCGLEAFYSGFSPKLREQALALAKRYDLFVTAGSDYHGDNKPLIRIGGNGLEETTDLPEGLRRFLTLF